MHLKRTEHSYLTTKERIRHQLLSLPTWFTYFRFAQPIINDRFKKGVIMKSIIMPKNEQLNDELNEQLLNEVKEKLAKEEAIVKNNKTKFTAVDMWNAQRNASSASSRIRRWNLN